MWFLFPCYLWLESLLLWISSDQHGQSHSSHVFGFFLILWWWWWGGPTASYDVWLLLVIVMYLMCLRKILHQALCRARVASVSLPVTLAQISSPFFFSFFFCTNPFKTPRTSGTAHSVANKFVFNGLLKPSSNMLYFSFSIFLKSWNVYQTPREGQFLKT